MPHWERNAQLALIAAGIGRIGPDTVELSNATGMELHKLRKMYWEYFVSRNLKIQAFPNIEKLGLKRALAIVEVDSDCAARFFELFQHAGNMLYVTSISETTVPFTYLIYFTLPSTAEEMIKSVFSRLLKHFNPRQTSWHSFTRYRRVPMNLDYFDFEHSTWNNHPYGLRFPDFDIPEVMSEHIEDANHFDKLDLSIVDHMQNDASVSANQISRDLAGIMRGRIVMPGKHEHNQLSKVVRYHKARHVLERGLVNGYSLDWTRAAVNTHGSWGPTTQYATINLITDRLSSLDLNNIKAVTSEVPFIWAEASSKDQYFARFHVPFSGVEAIRVKLSMVAARVGSSLIELSGRRAVLGLNTSGYDAETGWVFDEASVISSIREKLLDISVPSALL